MRERCSKNAFCEMCRFGDFSGKCFGTEKQREMVGKYGGLEKFELIDECYKKDQRISELEEQLKNAIVPKFRIGDYFIEYWDKTPSIYQYQGNKHFKCLNKKQGYHCDYVILGALLLEEDFIKQITKEEAQAKLEELKGENK